MTNPAIQIPSCRGDGRCPECERSREERRELAALPLLPCGCHCCRPCVSGHGRALLTAALRQRDAKDAAWRTAVADGIVMVEERDAAIRQVKELCHPCPCGKDSASIKWARCYSCRQAYHAEMERAMAERDAAIRKASAERAMLDEILALPDIEAPTGDATENVTSVVANALEALREERDAAIRERDFAYFKGIKDVRMIRCMHHREVPAMNATEAAGGECAVCAVAAVEEQRASARGVIEDLRESLDRQEEEIAALTRERDEALADARRQRLLVANQTEHISRLVMDTYSAGQNEAAAQQRAERAEALLRECDKALGETSGAVADLLCDPAWVVLHNHGWAALKAMRPRVEALLAKIREHLGAPNER